MWTGYVRSYATYKTKKSVEEPRSPILQLKAKKIYRLYIKDEMSQKGATAEMIAGKQERMEKHVLPHLTWNKARKMVNEHVEMVGQVLKLAESTTVAE